MGLLRVFKDRYRNYCMRNHDTTAFHGLDVQVRRSGMIAPILHQIWFDACELLEIAGLSVAIHPGDRVLELGAGLGIISALAGRATGPTGQVRSYEANPALHADTQAFFAANAVSNVTLVNAVLVSDGELTPRQFHLAGSFAESPLLGVECRGSQGTVEGRAESLSAVLADYRPDVLICDIEGAEVDLFPNFPASTQCAAVIELHPDRLTPAQVQSIHDGMAAQGLHRQQPGPGGTVEVYLRRPG